MPKDKKVVGHRQHSSKKQAKAVETVSLYKLSPKWSFAKADIEDKRWGILANTQYLGGMLARFKEWERVTWERVLTVTAGRKHNTQSHPMLVSDLIKDAGKRLTELNLDSYDILYSLTITGKQRVWGIMIEETGTFQVLWYDPMHEIYPVEK